MRLPGLSTCQAGTAPAIPAFNLIQNATDTGEGALVFFLFDLLCLDGEHLTGLPLVEREARLASLLKGVPNSLRYTAPTFASALGPPGGGRRSYLCYTVPQADKSVSQNRAANVELCAKLSPVS